MTARKKETFEAAIQRLEAIVGELEGGEQTLEEALKKFEEGLEIGKRCREFLDRADLRVRELGEVEADESGGTPRGSDAEARGGDDDSA